MHEHLYFFRKLLRVFEELQSEKDIKVVFLRGAGKDFAPEWI